MNRDRHWRQGRDRHRRRTPALGWRSQRSCTARCGSFGRRSGVSISGGEPESSVAEKVAAKLGGDAAAFTEDVARDWSLDTR